MTPPDSSGYGRGAAVESVDGRLTPYPRGYLGVLSAGLRLFVAHWRAWLVLGLISAFVPALLSGLLDVVLYASLGFNPWRPIDPGFANAPLTAPRPAQLPAFAAITVGQFVVTLAYVAWSVVCVAGGARAAILGQPVSVGASVRQGWARLASVLAATVLAYGGVFAVFTLVTTIYTLTAPALPATQQEAAAGSIPGPALAAAFLGFLLLVVAGPVALYALVRLLPAPFLVVTEGLGVRAALGRSWALTRGQWWRTAMPVLAVLVLGALVESLLGAVQSWVYAAYPLLAQPLVEVATTPLTVLVCVAVVYDLRLRREGYQPLQHNA